MQSGETEKCSLIDREINSSVAWTNRQWCHFYALHDYRIYTAKYKDKIVGVVAFAILAKRVHVYRLIVCPWHRFNHVGEWLLLTPMFDCRGVKSLTIDVDEDDLDAQQFLRAGGLRGRMKTKPEQVRDGWKSPEIIGKYCYLRFTLSNKQVADRCKKHTVERLRKSKAAGRETKSQRRR